MAWVVKNSVPRTLASGRVVVHTYFRVKERWPNGTVQVLGSFRRKPEAYAFLDRVEKFGLDPAAPVPGPKGATVGDLVKEFLQDRFPAWDPAGPALASKYFRSAKHVLDRFAAFVGSDLQPVLLTDEHPKAFGRALAREELAETTVFSYLGYVSLFLRWAYKQRRIPAPVEVVRRDPKVRRPAFCWEELAALLEQAKAYPPYAQGGLEAGRLFPILATLVYSGIRRDELCTLQWRDVLLDEQRPVILIRHKPRLPVYRQRFEVVDGVRRKVTELAQGAWFPKHRTNRTVPVLPPLARILVELRPANPAPDAFVFTTGDGRPLSKWALSSTLRRFGKATLERPLGTHVFRHSTATLLARRGCPAFALQAVLGHKDIAMTMRYLDGSQNFASLPPNILPDLEQPKAIAEKPATSAAEAAKAEEKPRLPDRVAERLALPLWTTAAR